MVYGHGSIRRMIMGVSTNDEELESSTPRKFNFEDFYDES